MIHKVMRNIAELCKKEKEFNFEKERMKEFEEADHKQKTELNLSEKIVYGTYLHREGAEISCYLIEQDDIKEFIKRREKENKDLEEDIIALIEINNSKKDLILRIRRLCKAHKEEREKLAGDKLV